MLMAESKPRELFAEMPAIHLNPCVTTEKTYDHEIYTCPVYNYVVSQKKRVGIYNVLKSEMHGIGTPSDLEKYLSEA